MSFIRVMFLLYLLAFSSFVYAAEINVNFRDMEMQEFVSFVSEFTGRNFVYDKKDLKGQVSIESSSEMGTDDIMEIFASTLRANGLELVDRGTYVEIVRQSDISDIADSDGVGDGNALITTILTSHNYDASLLAGTLIKLKSKAGYVDVLKGLNAIVIRDRIDRITKLKKLMEKLEMKAAGYTIHIVKVEHASASEMESTLKKLYSDLQKKMMVANDPVIVADDYSNLLVVACAERDFEKISYVISQIDSPIPSDHNAPKVFYLNNANAEDVEKVLSKLTGVENEDKGKKASNSTSTVAFDAATNSIIVFGSPDLYSKVEGLIEKLDRPREQVYVEALIIETSIENGSDFGVEWQVGAGNDSQAGTIGYLGSDGALTSFQSSVLDGDSPNFGALSSGFNLGILGDIVTYEGVSFPTLGILANFVKTASGINILSNPQILTLDNEEAEIFVGENRPFLTSTKYDSNNNPVQSYDYRDVGVKLNIVPQISSNDTITLKIEQEVKKVSGATADVVAPVTLTRSTKTKVKLKDGAIMVISGLLKDDSETYNSSVPWLSSIPVIGWLFKNKNSSSEKTNMMVFISTSIIRTQEDAKKLTEKKQNESSTFKEEIDNKIQKEFR
ncbi:general secretion pathway protein D [Denitrovibrio acetiphilus DSM 12809]|uniref:General secretion pathway protein D n=1 Tax=Denitrovibrio acetiphilus (strain DSM 12809 / NBRC 114555 / N2460) TaxID=522772 RepID=D4H3X7_DENA2|nr:type II secretion system secretin GspD [Denitrovibrio acetiphilus]ADD67288.1 general secretion pathway protein D [Denitrovibrio acetiphilus DSM 12809]